jgi:hypothetical protein
VTALAEAAASFPDFVIGGVSAPPVLVSGDFTIHDANH